MTYMEYGPNVEYHRSEETKCDNAVMNQELEA
jgi:hypothetical protein